MSQSRISRKLTLPTWAAFQRHCHRFLAIGYQEALPRIQSEPDEETDITGYICEALEQWFRDHPEESYVFFIKEDPPLSGSGRTGKRRPRTDIIMSYAAGKRPEFFFEAKRLYDIPGSASRYTGKEGMGCFINGRYASRCPEAAMIGYVQSETLEHWQSTLRLRVDSLRLELEVEGITVPISFDGSFPLEWSSSHRRKALASLELFHILLDCRK